MDDRSALPNAVDEAMSLWLWFEDRAKDFPTRARHTVGERLVTTTFDLMELLVQATYARRGSTTRGQSLARANVKLAMLRLLVRGCRDQRYLSVSQYEHATERLVALGRAVGAWLRSAEQQATTDKKSG